MLMLKPSSKTSLTTYKLDTKSFIQLHLIVMRDNKAEILLGRRISVNQRNILLPWCISPSAISTEPNTINCIYSKKKTINIKHHEPWRRSLKMVRSLSWAPHCQDPTKKSLFIDRNKDHHTLIVNFSTWEVAKAAYQCMCAEWRVPSRYWIYYP